MDKDLTNTVLGEYIPTSDLDMQKNLDVALANHYNSQEKLLASIVEGWFLRANKISPFATYNKSSLFYQKNIYQYIRNGKLKYLFQCSSNKLANLNIDLVDLHDALEPKDLTLFISKNLDIITYNLLTELEKKYQELYKIFIKYCELNSLTLNEELTEQEVIDSINKYSNKFEGYYIYESRNYTFEYLGDNYKLFFVNNAKFGKLKLAFKNGVRISPNSLLKAKRKYKK